jgi:hypothetical protein
VRLAAEAPYIVAMSVGACVLATFHLLYNTLATNLRFSIKQSSACCGWTCFDCINYVICYCLLRKLCSEQKNIFFVIKWVFSVGYMATLVALVSGFKKENPDSIKDVDEVGADEGGADEISFESLLIIYMLQNVIFIALRPVLYTLWSLLMCFCDRGTEYDKEDQFDWSIISFGYIDFQNSYYKNFTSFQKGKPELEFTRQMTEVR